MYFDELQHIRLFFISLLEPREGFFILTEPQVSIHKGARWSITCDSPSLQFGQEPKRITAPSSVRVRADQYSERAWAAVRHCDRLLQYRDGISGLIVGDQHESQVHQGAKVIRPCRHCGAQLSDGLVVVAGLKQCPPEVLEGNSKRVEFPAALGRCHCFVPASLACQPQTKSLVSSRAVRV